MKTDDNRCRECGTKLSGRNAIDVGYCIPCFNMMMCDDDEEDPDDNDRRCHTCGDVDGMVNPCCPGYDRLHFKNCGYG